MFKWIKPGASAPRDAGKTPGEAAKPVAPSNKDKLIREAMGHARVAREAIGEETLNRVRQMMEKQQQAKTLKAVPEVRQVAAAKDISPMEQAKKILLSMEPDKLAEHLRNLRKFDKTAPD